MHGHLLLRAVTHISDGDLSSEIKENQAVVRLAESVSVWAAGPVMVAEVEVRGMGPGTVVMVRD